MTTRRFRKATISDVALRAGVSITTVSHFVNKRGGACSPDTAERIHDAIAALHYTPAPGTRGRSQRATRTIGVCMNTPLDAPEGRPAPFLERLWRGIIGEADAQDYRLLHYPESVRNSPLHDAFLDGSVDGVLFSGKGGDTRPEKLADAGLPTITLMRPIDVPAGCGTVYADEENAVDLALSHLWGLGHRRIAHLTGPLPLDAGEKQHRDSSASALRRREAFKDWLRARNTLDEALIMPGVSWFRAGGDKAARDAVATWRALPKPPTAVFCANDHLALLVITAARAAGWRVPDDFSVVGVNNLPFAENADPPLTSVVVPFAEVGREAVRGLVRLMNGAAAEDVRVAVPVTELAVRHSTASPPKEVS